uniref:INCENP_ARK-bind domain-containing protein n=1 Tax=Syphacia muris TaxID=451379 RepID=A0A0N5APM6_9BILA
MKKDFSRRLNQKVEKREKEKRQKERLRHLEIQREKCQKAARDDTTKLITDAPNSPQKLSVPRDSRHYGRNSIGSCISPVLPEKCLSADKLPLVDAASVSSGISKEEEGTRSRIMKWLKLSHSSPKKKELRRSSLYS